MNAVVLRGDARALPLPDASVDLIVTSPPYFGLRSYTDAGSCPICRDIRSNGLEPEQVIVDWAEHARTRHHYEGQIGSEATPAEWLAAMVECTREWMRVLKPQGSLFVNLGDKYSQRTQTRRSSHQPGIFPGKFPEFEETWAERAKQGAVRMPHQNVINDDGLAVAEKSLMGLPWRYALACTDQLGLILRRDIIWSKPNGLPESVTDRCRSSHEYVFHLVRQPRYYAAVDEIREGYAPETKARYAAGYNPRKLDGQRPGIGTKLGGDTYGENPLGKLPGSVWKIEEDRVWDIPSQPLTVPAHLGIDHFAAFPMELPRRLILGWSPPGVCVACGEGRRPVRGVDWSTVPHVMAEHRALTDAERSEAAEHFRAWQDSHGIPSRAIAELFPSRTGGLTGCVANWRQGLNLLTPEQVDVLEREFGDMPDRLRQLVHWRDDPSCGVTRLVPTAGDFGRDADPDTGILRRHRTGSGMTSAKAPHRSITGYACACPQPTAPTRPAIVLDPFGGTGTTALVAAMHGRTGITIDRSADYSRLAAWRTTDPGQRAAALQVPKPPPIPDGQEPLFAT